MNIDWMHVIWEGRWQALVLIAHGILSDVRTLWWFGPLLALVALGIGRKGMFRLAKYVASVFMHTHTLS